MSEHTDTDTGSGAPTRRDYLTYGGAVVGGGLLAGCAGSGSDAPPAGADSTDTIEGTASTDGKATETGDSSYAASIEPVGEVTFDSVPDEWVVHSFSMDMGIVCGTTDGIVETVGGAGGFDLTFYRMLPDVDVPDITGMGGLRGQERALNKEYIYEVDPDVIGIDPNWLIAYSSGEAKDIEEVIDNVAPFCGSYNRRLRGDSWPNWPNGEYQYYDLHELAEYWGQVFDEPERAGAMSEFNRSMVERVQSRIPDTDTEMGLIWAGSPYGGWEGGDFQIYNPISPVEEVYGKKQYRDLRIDDAFEGIYDGQSAVITDAEAVLEADPDVIILHFGLIFNQMSASSLYDGVDAEDTSVVEYALEQYRTDPVLSELTAVRNDEIYLGTPTSSGPIMNTFNTEILAKQLYPDTFGEWPGFNDDNTYDLPEEERLFDRQRVADICNGEL
jgi:iron complex transport system substrate-binding protein